MDDNAFYVTFGWMRNRLGLDGVELGAYAVIYGFTQDGTTYYHGGLKYLMDVLGCSKSTILRALNSLVEKNIIKKYANIINNVTYANYCVNYDLLRFLNRGWCQNETTGVKNEPGVVSKSSEGGVKMKPNNIDNNKINNNKNIKEIYKESKEESQPIYNWKAKEKDMPDAGNITCPKEQDKQDVYSQLQNSYNTICISLPRCTLISDKRKKAINAILGQFSIDQVTEAFKKVQASDFLSGRSGAWQCSFDWLMITGNLLKVIEGNYDTKKNSRSDLGEREFTLTSKEAKLSADRDFVLR